MLSPEQHMSMLPSHTRATVGRSEWTKSDIVWDRESIWSPGSKLGDDVRLSKINSRSSKEKNNPGVLLYDGVDFFRHVELKNM